MWQHTYMAAILGTQLSFKGFPHSQAFNKEIYTKLKMQLTLSHFPMWWVGEISEEEEVVIGNWECLVKNRNYKCFLSVLMSTETEQIWKNSQELVGVELVWNDEFFLEISRTE